MVRFLGQEDQLEKGLATILQYSWASLVAQLVKNLPAMQETWVSMPGLGRSPEEGKGYHSSILAWRISWTDHGVTKSWMQLSDFHLHYHRSWMRITII